MPAFGKNYRPKGRSALMKPRNTNDWEKKIENLLAQKEAGQTVSSPSDPVALPLGEGQQGLTLPETRTLITPAALEGQKQITPWDLYSWSPEDVEKWAKKQGLKATYVKDIGTFPGYKDPMKLKEWQEKKKQWYINQALKKGLFANVTPTAGGTSQQQQSEWEQIMQGYEIPEMPELPPGYEIPEIEAPEYQMPGEYEIPELETPETYEPGTYEVPEAEEVKPWETPEVPEVGGYEVGEAPEMGQMERPEEYELYQGEEVTPYEPGKMEEPELDKIAHAVAQKVTGWNVMPTEQQKFLEEAIREQIKNPQGLPVQAIIREAQLQTALSSKQAQEKLEEALAKTGMLESGQYTKALAEIEMERQRTLASETRKALVDDALTKIQQRNQALGLGVDFERAVMQARTNLKIAQKEAEMRINITNAELEQRAIEQEYRTKAQLRGQAALESYRAAVQSKRDAFLANQQRLLQEAEAFNRRARDLFNAGEEEKAREYEIQARAKLMQYEAENEAARNEFLAHQNLLAQNYQAKIQAARDAWSRGEEQRARQLELEAQKERDLWMAHRDAMREKWLTDVNFREQEFTAALQLARDMFQAEQEKIRQEYGAALSLEQMKWQAEVAQGREMWQAEWQRQQQAWQAELELNQKIFTAAVTKYLKQMGIDADKELAKMGYKTEKAKAEGGLLGEFIGGVFSLLPFFI